MQQYHENIFGGACVINKTLAQGHNTGKNFERGCYGRYGQI